MNGAELSTPFCIVTNSALARVRDGQGRYFEPLMRIDPDKFAEDTLDPRKAEDQAAVLAPYADLTGKTVLEIGSGCGVTHIVWTKKFKIDGRGIEPEGEGFDNSAAIARDLLSINGLDPGRIVNARGEKLPFPDRHFDIVYSSNVLEHTDDPARVLREALRVLKPGGVAQVVCPNYRSYFDGHYAAFHPPIFSNAFFRWWIKWVYRRDPAFAATIRTEINAAWAKRVIAGIGRDIPLTLLTLGQEKFMERMTAADIARWMGLGVVGKLLGVAKRLGLNRMAAKCLVATGGWTPLIVTVRREP